MLFFGVWQIYEIARHKVFVSALLKTIRFFIVLQFLIGVAALIYINTQTGITAKSVLQGGASISGVTWIVFGLHLLCFILVNSFLYERLMEKEIETSKDLKISEENREEIRSLMLEREALTSSLIESNKKIISTAFTASISHELSQPLSAMLINVQFMKSLTADGKLRASVSNEVVDELEGDVQRISRIIKTLKNMFSSRTLEMECEDLESEIKGVIGLVKSKLMGVGVQLELEFEKGLRINLIKGEFEQILLNLVQNSLDAFIVAKTDSPRISVRSYSIDNLAFIRISDNGPGVPEGFREDLSQLFSTTKQSGLGLGLWLCSHIMSRHQGSIRCEGIAGEGASFLLQFPKSP